MTAPMENGADPAHPVPPEWLEAKTKGRAALAAEKRRQQANAGGSSGPSGGCSQYLSVEFDTPGPDSNLNISMSTPSGVSWDDRGGGSGVATTYSGCIGGSYRFSVSKGSSNWVNAGSDDGFSASGSFGVGNGARSCSVRINTFGLSVDCY